MNKRSGHSYGTMAERVAATKAAAAPPPSRRGPEGLKHCWVRDELGRLPGLLLEWRRTASGWQGRVVRPVPDADRLAGPGGPGGPGGWILVEEWLPAEVLDQA